jgi:hypothetical protein
MTRVRAFALPAERIPPVVYDNLPSPCQSTLTDSAPIPDSIPVMDEGPQGTDRDPTFRS